MMLQTKYQGSRPCVSDKKIFHVFPISLCKTCDPWCGAISSPGDIKCDPRGGAHFGPKDII